MHNNPINPVTGNILRVFFCYAVPSVIGMLAMSCAVVVDGLFLGRYAGTLSLAAVNLTVPANGIIFGLALMFSVGGALRCGTLLGAGKHRAADGCFAQTLVFVAAMAVLLTVLGTAFMDELVAILGADAELASAVAEYLHIVLLFTIFQFGAICLTYFLRAAGRPMHVLTAMTAGSLANILLDWLFIVQFGMGHRGAALGTGLAEALTFVLLCRPFVSGRVGIAFRWRREDLPEIVRAAVNGFPEFLNELTLAVIIFILNWMIMDSLGQAGVAAFAIVNYMLFTGMIVSYGISEALQSIVSLNFGAAKYVRVRRFFALSAVSVSLIGLFISALLALAPQSVSSLFLQGESLQTKKLTHHYISIIWPIFIVNGINVMLIAYLTALNRCRASNLLVLTKNLLLPSLFLFIIHMILNHNAIVIVLPLAEVFTLFLGLWLLHRNSPENHGRESAPTAALPVQAAT